MVECTVINYIQILFLVKCGDTDCGNIDDSELAARIGVEEDLKFAQKLASTQDQIMTDADVAQSLASNKIEEMITRRQDVEAADVEFARILAASEAHDEIKRIEADAAIARRLAESENQTGDGEFMPSNDMNKRKTTSPRNNRAGRGGRFLPFPRLDFSWFSVPQCVVCGEVLTLIYAKHPFFTDDCFCPRHSTDGMLWSYMAIFTVPEH